MKRMIKIFLVAAMLPAGDLFAQELYVSTEPASNMPRGGLGIRLMNEGMFGSEIRTRTGLELMTGVTKNLMVHASAYLSDYYRKQQRLEAVSFYAKYRFLSADRVQRHTRSAVFGRYTSSKNLMVNDDISLEGDNTGIQGGLIVTQLLHKLALSASASYTRMLDVNDTHHALHGYPSESIGYTFSSGYLVFPRVYKDYKQTNMNLYLEFLGKSNPGKNQHLMDVAPAVQFIFGSKVRVDASRQLQLWNNMRRTVKNKYLVRVEYNLYNIF
ncbi:hypothetical protein [Hufsiella ginkgonis]|uniref:DUF3316 domain-containing protein n=1 Tax=Hufsiella ginkgonis TaxID=2695274 RepID=A0A7K1XV34_9SPHI|nr:hypothetical protein [Hufsiella ginkgonis]MXV14629.1 hypothetical protein [Hufsiella ginkgonis]